MSQPCEFCRRIAASESALDNAHAVAFPDAFPVSPGHQLVIPRDHVADLFELSPSAFTAAWQLVARLKRNQEDSSESAGFNIGINVGPVAGRNRRARTYSCDSALRRGRARPTRRHPLGHSGKGALLVKPQGGGGSIAFGERLLSLLEQGRFTATYKYAVLLALLDLCVERGPTTGKDSLRLPTADIAEKVIELYWPHTIPFSAVSGSSHSLVLRQNQTGQAEIVSAITRFREQAAAGRGATLTETRIREPDKSERLWRHVEWKLAEMPLPRLQLVGNTWTTFLYAIGWDESIRAGEFRLADFDRSIEMRPGVATRMVELSGLLRPLIQREWASWIARQHDNRELIEDSYLDDFLFGQAAYRWKRCGLVFGICRETDVSIARGRCGRPRLTTSCRGRATSTTGSRT